jgi:hypothetical protein
MTTPFPRLVTAWLRVRVANRKKVRRNSSSTPETGGLSPFRGHSSALHAGIQFTNLANAVHDAANETGVLPAACSGIAFGFQRRDSGPEAGPNQLSFRQLLS